MLSLGLLYYSACRISDHFAGAVRADLMRATEGQFPIVNVTRKPVPVEWSGVKIVVGEAECGPPSIYSVYRQILIAAETASTYWVACVEDDTIYPRSHFSLRPDDERFHYNRNRWVLTRRLAADGRSREGLFYWRERTQMAQCICRRDVLVRALRERFAKYPNPVPDSIAYKAGWGEPGRYEKNLGLPRLERCYFESAEPSVTINHAESLRGRRAQNPDDIVKLDLEPWGNATDLWRRIVG